MRVVTCHCSRMLRRVRKVPEKNVHRVELDGVLRALDANKYLNSSPVLF